ncbi:uncharacterized protein LOC115953696 [Quercus lobata]|uniref:uncharacterized protein LOC115953696 n=1 Tax=Quercus lobata TaxID=97700 RepID=UPI001245A1FE|nr:uncharacterized protein LOC115953696 [Quercus lobata]
MVDLRSLRRHEVFLSLKKDLAMMKEEEGRHNAAMKAFNVAEKRTNELKNKLTKVERDKKSVEAALDSVERQAEGQRVLLRQAEDQLAAYKGQIITLKKKLEEAKKARAQAEQDGYDVGVAETEKALRVRAEVLGVCRNYCLQKWNEAFNQAGVEASSVLRRAESVYYPPAIRASSSTSSKVVLTPCFATRI